MSATPPSGGVATPSEGGVAAPPRGRRPSTRRAVAAVVAVVAVVVVGLVAYRTFTREPTDRRGDEAAADAVKIAVDEYRRLTGEAEQRQGLDDEQFASEMGGFVDERVGDVPVEQGDGRVVWRATYLGEWNNVAGGWLAQSVVAVLCVEVTVDRHATPMVQMVDADCPSDLPAVPSDAPRATLPTPWPPARPTS